MDNPPELVDIIPNVKHGDKLGCAKVFASEYDAERALDNWYDGIGVLICCDGYFNAVFLEYSEDEFVIRKP